MITIKDRYRAINFKHKDGHEQILDGYAINEQEDYTDYFVFESTRDFVNHCIGSVTMNCGRQKLNLLISKLPDDIFVPSVEYIENISAGVWFSVMLSAMYRKPKYTGNIHHYHFWLSDSCNWGEAKTVGHFKPEKSKYGYGFKFEPFMDFDKSNGDIVYGTYSKRNTSAAYYGYYDDDEVHQVGLVFRIPKTK